MNTPSVDWPSIRSRAAEIPVDAFEFVRDGLKHTVQSMHGPATAEQASASPDARPRPRHVSGQQLCQGLRDLAVQRWGLLSQTVLRRWGIETTEDFGTIVFAMIDRQELKASDNDSIEDFKGVFNFQEAFSTSVLK